MNYKYKLANPIGSSSAGHDSFYLQERQGIHDRQSVYLKFLRKRIYPQSIHTEELIESFLDWIRKGWLLCEE